MAQMANISTEAAVSVATTTDLDTYIGLLERVVIEWACQRPTRHSICYHYYQGKPSSQVNNFPSQTC